MRWHKYIHTHRNTYSIIPKAFLRSPGFCQGGHTFGSPSLGWLGLNRSGHHSSSPPSSLSSGHSGSQGLCRHGLYIANSGISVSNLALWHQPRAETFPHVLSLPAQSALTLPLHLPLPDVGLGFLQAFPLGTVLPCIIISQLALLGLHFPYP